MDFDGQYNIFGDREHFSLIVLNLSLDCAFMGMEGTATANSGWEPERDAI
jgi:hypothetical protein